MLSSDITWEECSEPWPPVELTPINLSQFKNGSRISHSVTGFIAGSFIELDPTTVQN